ncbi:putative peptidoglycan lipid II flippase [Dongia mobilis]|uniref:Probable lipid II flippase MurJ n=1 Tax=Dongia mobilis TaxID=578943 RepID=A0A4R6WKP7_9PROT|nr:murein biosynthesis integral membrane protein MurJ [Dongia mobilis]TDQ78811.1 putative peptidoglycan lipid II flippase [Dongia mobilis]
MFSLRAVATVGGMTLISRLLGFVREILIAGILGTGPMAEAFIVAMRLPNLLRQMFAEGAFSAAFIPIFTRRMVEEGAGGARRFAEQVLSVMLMLLLALTLAAELAMPWLIQLFAPGFDVLPEKFAATVLFTSITFPYILFMSLCSLQGGMLNGLQKFAHTAAVPIILNLVLVTTLWFVEGDDFRVAQTLSWAVVGAGLAQFLFLTGACHKAGIVLRLVLPRLTPEVRRLGRLMLPGLIGASVTQINLVVSTILASLHPGAISYIYYADRLYQLPLALIGTAIGVVLLPSLTRALRDSDPAVAMRMHNRALELGLLLSLPSMVGLMVAAQPIIVTLYERGKFTASDSEAVALALLIMAAGLPAYVGLKALTVGFLAREDTTTPFKFAVVSVLVNISISAALTPRYGFVGVAFGMMVAAWVNAALLTWTLMRRGFLVFDERFQRFLPRQLAACAGLAAATWASILAFWPEGDAVTAHRVVATGLIIAVGAIVFAVLALLLRVTSRSDLSMLRRKR